MKREAIALPGTLIVTLAAYGILGVLLLGGWRGAPPPFMVPVIPLFSHIIALVNAGALASLLLGYRSIRRGDLVSHRAFMLSAFVLISTFLALYVTRIYFGGIYLFKGPRLLYLYLYLPALAVHIGLSIISIPLVVYNIFVGAFYKPEDVGKTWHPKVGRLAVRLWSLSLALGISAYLMLHHIS